MVLERREIVAALVLGLISLGGCRSSDGAAHPTNEVAPHMAVHYLEIVTEDADRVAALYERMYGLSFGAPDADLGQARVATQPDGTLVGIRKPLAAHEEPIVRAYLTVDDIQKAVKAAEGAGAMVAYPPTHQGRRGTFAIVIQGGVQHGLWQR